MPLAHLVDPSPYQPIENADAATSRRQPRRHRKFGSKGRKMRRKEVKTTSSETQDPIIPLTPISKLNQATHLPGRSSPGEETVPRSPALQTTLEPGPIKMDGEILTARHPVVLPAGEAFSNETRQRHVGHGQVSKPRPGEPSHSPSIPPGAT